jgi:hypothetical protein
MPQDTKSMPDPHPEPPSRREGDIVSGADPEELRQALDAAFDYRGDVTLVLRDGRGVEGYLFDRIPGPDLAGSWVRILRSSDGIKERVSYAEIAELRFSGKDTAAGKTWENWLRRYAEKRFRGEAASLESEPLA